MSEQREQARAKLKTLKAEFDAAAEREGTGAYPAFAALVERADEALVKTNDVVALGYIECLKRLCYVPEHSRQVNEVLRILKQ